MRKCFLSLQSKRHSLGLNLFCESPPPPPPPGIVNVVTCNLLLTVIIAVTEYHVLKV